MTLCSTSSRAADEDYSSTIAILSFPAGSEVGAVTCTTINILDDEYFEGREEFFVHIEVDDLNIKVPPAATGWATVYITDNDRNFLAIFKSIMCTKT